jgi:hypothetical protein
MFHFNLLIGTALTSGWFADATKTWLQIPQAFDQNTNQSVTSAAHLGTTTQSVPGVTPKIITNSLRFNASSTTSLTRTFVAGDRNKWTWSGWVKNCMAVNDNITLFGMYLDSNNWEHIYIQNRKLGSNSMAAGSYQWSQYCNALFRDPAGWSHIVVSFDSEQSIQSNRIKYYANGVQLTSITNNVTNNLGQFGLSQINTAYSHRIGVNYTGTYDDFYLADTYFIDGAALDPTYFGGYDSNGVWVPVDYTVTPVPIYGPFFNTTSSTISSPLGLNITNSFDGNSGTTVTMVGSTYTGTTVNQRAAYLWDLGTPVRCGKFVFSNTSASNTASAPFTLWYSTDNFNWVSVDGYNVTGSTYTFTSIFDITARYWALSPSAGYWDTTTETWSEMQLYPLINTSAFGITGFHLEFKNAAALGTDTSGNSNNYNLISGGSNIGSLTGDSGLAGLFDGSLSTGANVGSGNGWGGKDVGPGLTRTLTKVVIKSRTTVSLSGNNPGTITGTIYGSNTAPSTGTDGVSLWTGSLTNTIASVDTITSIAAGAYRYVWVYLVVPGGAQAWIGELELYYTGGNDFGSTGLTAADQMVDTPTNNYATLNPLSGYNIAPSDGNLKLAPNASWSNRTSTIAVSSGIAVCEMTVPGSSSTSAIQIGVRPAASKLAAIGDINANNTTYYSSGGALYENGTDVVYYSAYTSAATVIGCVLNKTNNTVSFYKDGTLQGTRNLLTTSEDYVFVFGNAGSGQTISVNFGQTTFTYSYGTAKALCSNNLPAVAIVKPKNYMNVAAYTGNGGTKTITGVGFQPDLLIHKNRTTAWSWNWYDSLRGTINCLSSDSTNAETSYNASNNSSYGYVSTIDSDGFSVVSGSQSHSYANYNGENYVGFCWKKGSTPGFDIVTYTGNGNAQTINHSLGAVPAMIIVKSRSAAIHWAVYHKNMNASPAGYAMYLEMTLGAQSDIINWNNTLPTSNVFSVGQTGASASNTSYNGATYIAYLWTEVPGFSKFGSYTGNSNADGPFVYCGFKPKFVMTKSIAGTAHNWQIFDSARDTYNAMPHQSYPNASDAEYSDVNSNVDFLSNGFKLRGTDGGKNTNGETIIYAAFAELPFGGSNVSPATAVVATDPNPQLTGTTNVTVNLTGPTFIGKYFTSPTSINSVTLYATTNGGFTNGSQGQAIRLDLYASNTMPTTELTAH